MHRQPEHVDIAGALGLGSGTEPKSTCESSRPSSAGHRNCSLAFLQNRLEGSTQGVILFLWYRCLFQYLAEALRDHEILTRLHHPDTYHDRVLAAR